MSAASFAFRHGEFDNDFFNPGRRLGEFHGSQSLGRCSHDTTKANFAITRKPRYRDIRPVHGFIGLNADPDPLFDWQGIPRTKRREWPGHLACFRQTVAELGECLLGSACENIRVGGLTQDECSRQHRTEQKDRERST
jgi:hypothetical protein